MGTRVCDRKQCHIEFEECAKDIIAFVIKYCPRFPKSTRFLFQTRLADLSISILENIDKAQAILSSNKETKIYHLQMALGCLNTLETTWNIAYKSYSQYMTTSLYFQLGELIHKERALLLGVIKGLM